MRMFTVVAAVLGMTCLLACSATESTSSGARVAPVQGQSVRGCVIEPGTSCRDANLAGLDLQGVDLTGADMYRTSLEGANLAGADLTEVKLDFGSLDYANLEGADLSRLDRLGSMVGAISQALI